MKQKDLALILVIVFISAVVALVVSRWLFASPKNTKQTAEVVDVIEPEFTLPSSKYFSVNSVNPTQQIEIEPHANNNPFKTGSQ